MTALELTPVWDKVFPESDKVEHNKITFRNRYGIELAADVYKPKNASGKLPAIGCESFVNFPTNVYADEIENAVMIVHGEAAHSFYFGKDTYDQLAHGVNPANKEFVVVEGANHTDLYDQVDIIPFDTITEFYRKYLA